MIFKQTTHAVRLAAFVVLCSGICSFTHAQELQWRDATTLTIEGRGWSDTAGPYDRLPDSAQAKVSETAWNLSKDSAGLCVRFVTSAPSVSVRWSLTKSALEMPHMPATGVSGVDLYARAEDRSWRFVGNGRPHTQENNLATFNFPSGAKEARQCLLYLPLYNGTKSLEIGVPADAQLDRAEPRPESHRKPVVVYGTSIAQGGCASRPGLAWPAILGRLLDRPVINLGFSSTGTMAPPVAEVLAEIDAAALVVDCIWNIGDNAALYNERVPILVETIRRKHRDMPIVFVGQSLIRPDAHPTPATLAQEVAVRKLQDSGIEGLYLIPGRDLVGDDGEGTVDGVHPNDIGMQRQALAMLPSVEQVLAVPVKPSVYIDADTACEVDDPYGIYRALVAPELNVVGLSSMGWTGPLDFPTNTRSSQAMNEKLLDLMGLKSRISHPIGAMHPMQDEKTPVDSPAVRDMIAKAKAMSEGQKLQVFVLGAFTNIASALLIDPSIKDKMTVHVMGYRHENGKLTTNESNVQGDLHAAAFLPKSGVELKIMSATTLRYFQWAKADVDAHFKGRGGVADLLVERWEAVGPNDPIRTVWDIAIFEAFLRPDLVTLTEFDHEGHKIYVWTKADIKAMQQDFWEATKAR